MRKLALVLFVLATLPVIAQPAGGKGDRSKEKREKVEQLKIAYFTKNLELTTEESEKFWPIYNEMSTKMRDNNKERMKLSKELKDNLETLKDAEIKAKMDAILNTEQQQVTIKKEYSSKIAAVIGYKKSVKLVSLEHQFSQELRKEFEKRKGEEGEHPRAPKE
jgi:hypothetical protein